MTHIDAHRNLVCHHLHKLAESLIFTRVDQMILVIILVGVRPSIIVLSIIYHVRDETKF